MIEIGNPSFGTHYSNLAAKQPKGKSTRPSYRRLPHTSRSRQTSHFPDEDRDIFLPYLVDLWPSKVS